MRTRIGFCLAASLVILAQVHAQQTPPKAQVELRWVESKPTKDLTEEEGYQTSCDPDSIMYPHKKPALVLTAAEVTEVRVKRHDFSKSGSGVQHLVAFHLTKEAREKLAAACDGDDTKYLTVMVDGKPWGLHRYEKDKAKPFVPESCRAETFLPAVGFFSSHAEAQKVANAVK